MTRLTVVLLTWMLFSCGGDRKSTSPKEMSSDTETPPINLLTLSEPQNEFMEALTAGILVLDSSGCLKIGESTIIWPHGFRLGNNTNGIYNSKGDIVSEVGNHVELSGGGCSDCPKEQVKRLIGSSPSEACSGDYWIVGEQITVK